MSEPFPAAGARTGSIGDTDRARHVCHMSSNSASLTSGTLTISCAAVILSRTAKPFLSPMANVASRQGWAGAGGLLMALTGLPEFRSDDGSSGPADVTKRTVQEGEGRRGGWRRSEDELGTGLVPATAPRHPCGSGALDVG
ncbi:uncharacterized protein EHS24_006105 [Apiotrichum porosum]|uniref:Uncharacterized protein n=1 Tax=Apiotrichum porosum TaxID=105984 RepID=A0A427Y0J8_9TREE|nr:uncharacterized protein EHS24_006105 [Apiotrichum porosum]RSH84582.1 hypothetical protein EHS24_006105 [Apiotrichum porosum]